MSWWNSLPKPMGFGSPHSGTAYCSTQLCIPDFSFLSSSKKWFVQYAFSFPDYFFYILFLVLRRLIPFCRGNNARVLHSKRPKSVIMPVQVLCVFLSRFSSTLFCKYRFLPSSEQDIRQSPLSSI